MELAHEIKPSLAEAGPHGLLQRADVEQSSGTGCPASTSRWGATGALALQRGCLREILIVDRGRQRCAIRRRLPRTIASDCRAAPRLG